MSKVTNHRQPLLREGDGFTTEKDGTLYHKVIRDGEVVVESVEHHSPHWAEHCSRSTRNHVGPCDE